MVAAVHTPSCAEDGASAGRVQPAVRRSRRVRLLLAITGLSADELPAFCAIAAAVLDGRHGWAHGMAVNLWRSGQRQLLWAPAVRRLVLRAGPWAPPGGAVVPTPEDVRAVEGALGLAEDGPASRAWRRELARASEGRGAGAESDAPRRRLV